jgi:hypothetical protein
MNGRMLGDVRLSLSVPRALTQAGRLRLNQFFRRAYRAEFDDSLNLLRNAWLMLVVDNDTR